MLVNDLLSILADDHIPPRIKNLAQGLFVAILALECYGHKMSYLRDGDSASEVEADAGLIARRALDDICRIGRRTPSVSRLVTLGVGAEIEDGRVARPVAPLRSGTFGN